MSARSDTGALVLVPNTLDHEMEAEPIEDCIALGVMRKAASLTTWLAEDARSTRAFLKRIDRVVPLSVALQAVVIHELPRPRKGNGQPIPCTEWERMLQPALDGSDVGLLSEAGLVGVADPGAEVVDAAHRLGIPVRALPGASALPLALAASGLNGQRFAFDGYLPQEGLARAHRLRQLEVQSHRNGQTQLLIETPYRNAAVLAALLATLQPTTRLSVSCGIGTSRSWTKSLTVAEWRQTDQQLPAKVPAVFAFLAT